MIHSIANNMVESMIRKNILKQNQENVNMLEKVIKKTITILILLLISYFMHVMIPGIFFMIYFFSLRERTGGFHFNSYLADLIGIVVFYITVITIASSFPVTYLEVLYVLVGIAAFIICFIGKVDHTNLNLRLEEVLENKKAIRFIVLAELICIVAGLALGINQLCIIYQALALILCALLQCISKLSIR